MGASAKAFAEAAQIIDDLIRRWIADLMSLKGRETAGKLKGELSDLRFDSNEFQLILSRIADKQFTNADVEDLANKLQFTATSVDGTLLGLDEEYKNFINSRYGSEFWNTLENDVRRMKNNIRREIMALSKMRASKEGKAAAAKRILVAIEKFNDDLAQSCDKIQSPLVRPKSS